VKIRFLPSALGPTASETRFLTSILVNEGVAIDAGSLGFTADLEVQRAVKHLLISHSHLDHAASLPAYLENVYTPDENCVTVYASDSVTKSLEQDLFNDRLCPDFIELSKTTFPFLKVEKLQAMKTLELEGLRITPVPVEHTVPTFGFVVEEAESAVVIATDTGPTERLWKEVNQLSHLKAVFLDCSFPDSHHALADVSKHLTPSQFAAELAKVVGDVRSIAVHVKAAFHSQVIADLGKLQLSCVEVLIPGKDYEF